MKNVVDPVGSFGNTKPVVTTDLVGDIGFTVLQETKNTTENVYIY